MIRSLRLLTLLTLAAPLSLTACGSSHPTAGTCTSRTLPTPMPVRKEGTPGSITFGLYLNGGKLVSPRTAFKVSNNIVWDARFIRPVHSGQLTLHILKLQCDSFNQVYSMSFAVPRGGATGWKQGIVPLLRLKYNIASTGRFIWRYTRGSTVLAQGEVKLTGQD